MFELLYYLVTLCGVYVVVWLCAAFGAIATMKKGRRAMKTSWREGGREVWFCSLCNQQWSQKHHDMTWCHWNALLQLIKQKKRLETQHKANMKWIADQKAKLANIMKKGMEANTTNKERNEVLKTNAQLRLPKQRLLVMTAPILLEMIIY